MASDRDILATALGDAWDDGNATGLDGWTGPGRGAGVVDDEAVRARRREIEATLDVELAGWRPPAREITDPAELEKLPMDSIVRAYGVAHQAVPSERGGALEWLKPAGQRTYTSAELLAACRGAGVTVLHEPVDEDEGADRA